MISNLLPTLGFMGALVGLVGCVRDTPTEPVATLAEDASTTCPTAPIRGGAIPDTSTVHARLPTWLSKLSPEQVEAVLIQPEELEGLNAQFSDIAGAWRDPQRATFDPTDRAKASIAERFAYLWGRIHSGAMVEGEPGALEAAQAVADAAVVLDHVRIVREETPMYCVPLTSGLYKQPVDKAFDRNRCASLHPAELVRVRRRDVSGRWLYVDAGHTVGWIQPAGVSGRITGPDLDRWRARQRLVSLGDDAATADGFPLRLGVSVPLVETTADGHAVWVPGAAGLRLAMVPRSANVAPGPVPLTRKALWNVAFGELGSPYGWGGYGGHRDCSRLLRDVFVPFGIQLARHSGVQAKLGTHNIDVAGLDEQAKREAIRRFAAGGVVLLYMPGHIMLYLGHDGDHDYAISSISEYLEPCQGGQDTVYRIDAVSVTTLELGRDTSKTAFIERITRLAVFGPGPATP